MISPDEEAILRDLRAAVVAVEDDGRIAYATPEVLHLLRWDDSLVGQPLQTIMPLRMRSQHAAGFKRYVETGVSRLQGSTVRVPALRRDGSEIEIDLTIRVFRRPDGTKLVSAAMSETALGRTPESLVVLETALRRRLYLLV